MGAALVLGPLAAQTPSFGPLDPANGFPSNYADGHGTTLGLCLADPAMCMLLQNVMAPIDGLDFPLNYGGTFPSEAFYWAATSTMDTADGGQALLVLALEASFANGIVTPGQQTTFARMRLRVDNLVLNERYVVTTPYGQFEAWATRTGRRGINITQDFGLVPGDFSWPLQANVFPFLRWDSGLPIVDGQGHRFIGDPNIAHTVTGSPTGNNFFRIDGRDVGGPGVHSISTNLFFVAGVEHSPPPQADFSSSTRAGNAPLGVAFTNRSTGAFGSSTWDFGDGTTSHSINPAHVFRNPGYYTVRLTVTGPGGSDSVTRQNLIHVLTPPPRLALVSNEGAGGRLRLNVAGWSHEGKLVVVASPAPGNRSTRAGPCSVPTGLLRPTVQMVRYSGASGSSTDCELRTPPGIAGQTWYFQAIDPGSCTASNVLPVNF